MKIFICKGGSSNVEDNTFPTGPYAPQIPFINMLFNEAYNLYNQGGPQYTPYSQVAGQTPAFQQSQQAIQNFGTSGAGVAQTGQNAAQNLAQGGGYNPTLQAGLGVAPAIGNAVSATGATTGAQAGVLNNTAQGAAGALNANLSGAQSGLQNFGVGASQAGSTDINPYIQQTLSGQGTMNPYLNQLVQDQSSALTRQFGDNVLPAIRGQANDAGQPGGVSQGIASGIAASRLNEDIGRYSTQLYANAFDQNFQNQANVANAVFGSQDQALLNQLTGQGQTIQYAGQQGQLGNQAAQIANQFGTGANTGNVQTGQLASNLLSSGGAQGIQQQGLGLNAIPAMLGAEAGALSTANQGAVQGQTYAQAVLQDQINNFNYNQNLPYQNLGQFQQFVTGPYGSSILGGANQSNANPYALPPGYESSLIPGDFDTSVAGKGGGSSGSKGGQSTPFGLNDFNGQVAQQLLFQNSANSTPPQHGQGHPSQTIDE